MPALTLRLGPARVRVESDNSRPLEALRLMFPEFAQSETNVRATDEPLRIAASTGGQFHLHRPESWQGAPPDTGPLEWPDLVSALEHTVADRLLLSQEEQLPLHAGGVNIDGSGVLILGNSGAGKSTLSIALARGGASMLGDDVVLLGPDGLAHPFQRRPKLDRDQAIRMGIIPTSTVLWDSDAEECWLNPSEWSGWSTPVRVDLAVDALHVPGATTTISAMSPAESLAVLVGSCFPTPDAQLDPLPGRLLALSTQCRGFRLRYGHVSEGVAAIRRVLADAHDADVGSGV